MARRRASTDGAVHVTADLQLRARRMPPCPGSSSMAERNAVDACITWIDHSAEI